jgi:hypothetical protein
MPRSALCSALMDNDRVAKELILVRPKARQSTPDDLAMPTGTAKCS